MDIKISDPKLKKIVAFLFSFLIVLLGFFLGAGKGTIQDTVDLTQELFSKYLNSEDESQVLVKRVVDGDTIVLENGEIIRYIGIDTPELESSSQSVQCFAQEAKEFNKRLVEGKEVRLEKDVSDRDRFGRLLRYVWIDDLFVNEYLVKEGYALASTYPPDVEYQDLFLEAQTKAKDENKGLWKSCKND